MEESAKAAFELVRKKSASPPRAKIAWLTSARLGVS
jgi:hypothetical protein